MVYASVVSRDSVHILLMLEAFNGLDVKFYYVQNAYLNYNPKEEVWFWSVKEFDFYKGIVLVVIGYLYVIKGSISEWVFILK